MKIIDLHTDTLTKVDLKESLIENATTHVDLMRAHKAGYSLWVAACFLQMPGGNLGKKATEYFLRLDKDIAANSQISAPYTTFKNYLENRDIGKVTVFKSLEEGEIIEGKVENLQKFYALGVRMMTLTWNYPNSLAWPNYPRPDFNRPEMSFGLTDLGKTVVSKMNDMKILLDVSHLGDKSFFDAVKIYKGPIIASHSNARSINPSVRNLTDEMIVTIAQSGGVIGLNLCDFFVRSSGNYIEDLIKHLEHIRKIGGISCVALGSDFDGIGTPPILTDCTKWPILFEELRKHGWSETDLEALSHKNFERVLTSL